LARSYVLDTHAFVFMLAAPKKLGARARTILERVEKGDGSAVLCAPVVAEVLLLRGLGRVGVGLADVRDCLANAPGLRFSPLDLNALDEFAALGAIADPFDRLIVSVARSLRAPLLTRDGALGASSLVETIW